MEETHRDLIEDLQQQHQREVAELLKEKEQLLQEETAATMAGKQENMEHKCTVVGKSLCSYSSRGIRSVIINLIK